MRGLDRVAHVPVSAPPDKPVDTLGHHPLDPQTRAELARRREEFWTRVGAIALGVFLGLGAYSVVVYVLFREWVQSL